jgi:3-oxoacyl-[acyl-carrier protein] reductase
MEGRLMPGRLEGRSAVVTGAARGIGRATAQVYAREGARVLVVDRDGDWAQKAAGEIGSGAVACAADVTSREDVQAMAAAAVEQFGGIDILTQNAGIYPNTRFEDITDDEWALVMNVNTRSALYTVQACLPHLKQSKYGRITITSSITGPKVGFPGFVHYGASKAALNGFIRSLALELVSHAITVNGVEPGTVLTEGVQEFLTPEVIEGVAANIPMRRFAAPIDIAHGHLFFASDEASYVTGQTIVVDGGQILPESPMYK